MKRYVAILVALLLGGFFVAPSASAHTPYCGIWWGSLAKSSAGTGALPEGDLTNVRTGQHACFDRIVLDVDREISRGYDVRYVDHVHEDGSGFLVPLRGGARLQIVARVPAYDDFGQPTYNPANRSELRDVSGYRTFRQVAWAGSFEGQTTIGLGVRARLPFRVFTLDGPGAGSRLVIDVAHRWF